MKEKTEQIKITNESEKLSFPGYATIYIAPRDKISEIPEGCRGMYRLAPSPRRSIKERIQRKISGKYDQLFSFDKPVFCGILYLIDLRGARAKANCQRSEGRAIAFIPEWRLWPGVA